MGERLQPINVTAATLTLDPDVHAGAIVTINLAATQTTTLPASAGDGSVYTIFIGTTKTGDQIIQTANATDVINGGVGIATDIAGVTCICNAADDTITMSGSTTGGVIGSWVRLTDVTAGYWMLEGFLASTGTEADPFSAAVS